MKIQEITYLYRDILCTWLYQFSLCSKLRVEEYKILYFMKKDTTIYQACQAKLHRLWTAELQGHIIAQTTMCTVCLGHTAGSPLITQIQ